MDYVSLVLVKMANSSNTTFTYSGFSGLQSSCSLNTDTNTFNCIGSTKKLGENGYTWNDTISYSTVGGFSTKILTSYAQPPY